MLQSIEKAFLQRIGVVQNARGLGKAWVGQQVVLTLAGPAKLKTVGVKLSYSSTRGQRCKQSSRRSLRLSCHITGEQHLSVHPLTICFRGGLVFVVMLDG